MPEDLFDGHLCVLLHFFILFRGKTVIRSSESLVELNVAGCSELSCGANHDLRRYEEMIKFPGTG